MSIHSCVKVSQVHPDLDLTTYHFCQPRKNIKNELLETGFRIKYREKFIIEDSQEGLSSSAALFIKRHMGKVMVTLDPFDKV